MKKIILAALPFLFFSCGNREEDCKCSKQKYTRSAIYTLPRVENNWDFSLVSATEWAKKGKPEDDAKYNCKDNGKTFHASSEALYSHGSDQQLIVEAQYRVSCK